MYKIEYRYIQHHDIEIYMYYKQIFGGYRVVINRYISQCLNIN